MSIISPQRESVRESANPFTEVCAAHKRKEDCSQSRGASEMLLTSGGLLTSVRRKICSQGERQNQKRRRRRKSVSGEFAPGLLKLMLKMMKRTKMMKKRVKFLSSTNKS